VFARLHAQGGEEELIRADGFPLMSFGVCYALLILCSFHPTTCIIL